MLSSYNVPTLVHYTDPVYIIPNSVCKTCKSVPWLELIEEAVTSVAKMSHHIRHQPNLAKLKESLEQCQLCKALFEEFLDLQNKKLFVGNHPCNSDVFARGKASYKPVYVGWGWLAYIHITCHPYVLNEEDEL
jgi:hypothetical protein